VGGKLARLLPIQKKRARGGVEWKAGLRSAFWRIANKENQLTKGDFETVYESISKSNNA
jgi:hypothetical protein